jgi:hypothetical protein
MQRVTTRAVIPDPFTAGPSTTQCAARHCTRLFGGPNALKLVWTKAVRRPHPRRSFAYFGLNILAQDVRQNVSTRFPVASLVVPEVQSLTDAGDTQPVCCGNVRITPPTWYWETRTCQISFSFFFVKGILPARIRRQQMQVDGHHRILTRQGRGSISDSQAAFYRPVASPWLRLQDLCSASMMSPAARLQHSACPQG